jgi:uncharacterized protein (TIGR02217 family)
MTDFIEESFPHTASVGSTGGPGFSTDVDSTESGYEFRNINWSQARHKYQIASGIADKQTWSEVKNFFMRCQGRAIGFRFLDPEDYSSAADGWSDPTPADQLIGVGDGAVRKFALVKSYDGYLRDITKPISGTVVASVNGVEVPADGFVLDPATGIIEFDTAPAAGKAVRAGFLFEVPCRFDSDELTASWSDANLLQGSVQLVELRIRRSL